MAMDSDSKLPQCSLDMHHESVTTALPVELPPSAPVYRVYKRRFWGLGQLVLLNIVVSWDWLTFSSISTTTAQYFGVSESAVNWMSTGYLFAFCVSSPIVIITLNKGGPKPAIITTSALLLIGNWIRYGGTRAGNFGVAMFGQILIGLAQPFCLSAPTRYSDLWFSDQGRTSATAVATLANPLGAALGELIDGFWVTEPGDVPGMVLGVTIIATIASLPSLFLPSGPPTPPSPSSTPLHSTSLPPLSSLSHLLHTPTFHLILLPFTVYVALFNSISTLLNQILSPHHFTETQSGIAGGLLILTGLLSSAVISPLTDRYKQYLLTIRLLVPVIAASYIALIYAPASTAGIWPTYVVCAVLGASSFGLLPVVLEFLVEVMYPVEPGVGSTLCWVGGQLFGGVFVVVMDALGGGDGGSMHRALVFAAALAVVVVPAPLVIGVVGGRVRRGRVDVDGVVDRVVDGREGDRERAIELRGGGGGGRGGEEIQLGGRGGESGSGSAGDAGKGGVRWGVAWRK